ncbi:beta-lactamase/transpeptidase-like protein [Chaetomium fimeti]|uniref:Beta-lactamase/transpeptidase-like protein n=1 Tax=Chaetomium fimeti TaxID=1854472 RepID=A0AAE0LND7_9PEZI|nr:beta-lactamase/transpeptidase-like protein [Chaetomium fimeti]
MVKLTHLLLGIPAALALECRPEGPIVPPPRNLKQSDTFSRALANLTATLDSAFKGEFRSSLDAQNVSMSVALVGLDQTEASTPLWEYHHLGSGNVNGTKSLDRHSQYLIGSVSKVITDAILLRSGVNMDDPVTKYLPSLANDTSRIDWESISLRALGGQLAGIPANFGFSEYHYIKTWFETLGFPALNDSSYPPCGVIGLNTACTREQFLTGLLTADPQALPQARPVYSNIAYTILAYAIEAATGKDYTAQLHDYLTSPLGMASTIATPGNDSRAVIPPGESTWGSDYGDNAPGGGLVSTLADLTSFVRAILARDAALGTPAEIRQWLQPRTFSGSRSSAVGLPWEMFRPEPRLLFPGYDAETGEGGHTVTIHAKDGAAYGYHARIALLDEYGVGLVLLTAGNQDALGEVYDAALTGLVPALDAVARQQAVEEYGGVFAGVSTEETGAVPVNATVELDGSSLRLMGLHRKGSDILAALQELWGVTLSEFLPSLDMTGVYRLYPTGIERKAVLADGREVVEEDWRVWWEVEYTSQTDMPGNGLSESDCLTWTLADWMYYGSQSADRVMFVKDAETGSVLGLDAPFLRTGIMGKSEVE